jgi:16S rRNA (guanine966-N2)-methyltransferase
MSGLRVIGGQAKGRKLFMVPGGGTRPITDRVKESLFNLLGPEIEGSSFLDLFAGTGSVGIEALSRHAAAVTFIERERRAEETIQRNLLHTQLGQGAQVKRLDVFAFLMQPGSQSFDYVYVAPPQYEGLAYRALETIDEHPQVLNRDAWVILQIDPHEERQLQLAHLRQFDRRKYGQTLLVFFAFDSADPA